MAAHLYAFTPGNMVASMMSTVPGLLEKVAMEEWLYGKARPLERMSALECGSRLANVRSGSFASVEQCPWYVGFTPDSGSLSAEKQMRTYGPYAAILNVVETC
jgi:hypothetical protein